MTADEARALETMRRQAARVGSQRGALELEIRRRWPHNEISPFENKVGITNPDTCPPYTFPAGTPVPPPERKDPACTGLTPDQEAFICKVSREIGKEVATYAFNPYLFPTPYSQDFDRVGTQSTTVATRLSILQFQIPQGYVGVWNHVGCETPPQFADLDVFHPTLNNATLKTWDSINLDAYGAQVVAAGSAYPIGTLLEPRPLFHALEPEMIVGVDIVRGAGTGVHTVRAVVRGRYWNPDIATRFHTFAKSD